MANSIMGNSQQNNFQSMFNAFKQNPLQFLSQRNINVPQQFQNNPRGYIQELLNRGQVSQEQLNKAMQMAQQMGVNLN